MAESPKFTSSDIARKSCIYSSSDSMAREGRDSFQDIVLMRQTGARI